MGVTQSRGGFKLTEAREEQQMDLIVTDMQLYFHLLKYSNLKMWMEIE
jgi:hypothetical protein